MRIALVAKPPTGRQNRSHTIPGVVDQLAALDIHSEVFETQYHAHALKIVQELSLTQFDALVALGGDGTNYHLLNGLLKFHPDQQIPPLGIIPVGRGNSFAKDLNIHSMADGIAAIARQKTLDVDVCRFTQGKEFFYFVNLMGFGFVTDVAQTAARFGWTGDLSYVIGVFHRTVNLQFHRMELEIDGTLFRGRNCFVEFCNSRYTGGNMLMAPEAQINDGYFDAVILSPLSRLSLLTTFPKLFKGTHSTNPRVRILRGKRAVVRTVPQKVLLPDGEIFGATPTTIEVLPRRVRYFYIRSERKETPKLQNE
ncbi:MAG: YegS/Rv2252/BmrU family lipid kinase [Deltaproteobacteria bacterium]|nr:YegS/Rv2252/BmrU family lipid kinase [Deltaproteobacteria bacterium]MBW1942693.1 YegS/Rv2252/BmrU family lipid kinase [Deltaproteobacteria bacterium]MBW2206233.1 YegS/Rv2252/BmrU family lipid kinase [Deltaproteobacteria bacterium]